MIPRSTGYESIRQEEEILIITQGWGYSRQDGVRRASERAHGS